MARFIVAVVTIVLSLACFHAAEAKSAALEDVAVDNPFYGKTPDKRAKRWIRFISLAPRTTPPPIFLVSPTKFEVRGAQELVLLSKRQYELFESYTRANKCDQNIGPNDQFQLIEERANGKTQELCRMTRPAMCRYTGGIAKLPHIDWLGAKWKLFKYAFSYGC